MVRIHDRPLRLEPAPFRRSHDDFRSFIFYDQRMFTESGKARPGGAESVRDLRLLNVVLNGQKKSRISRKLDQHALCSFVELIVLLELE